MDVGTGACQLGGVSLWRNVCAERLLPALAYSAPRWLVYFDEAELRRGPVDEGHAGHHQTPIEAPGGHQQRTPSQQQTGRQHNEPQHVATVELGTLGGKCAFGPAVRRDGRRRAGQEDRVR